MNDKPSNDELDSKQNRLTEIERGIKQDMHTIAMSADSDKQHKALQNAVNLLKEFRDIAAWAIETHNNLTDDNEDKE